MNKNIKTINKGDTNVRQDSGATMLKTVNMLDVSEADVVRGNRGEWDDFQLMGSSNISEREQRADEDMPGLEATLKRARNRSIGRKIRALTLDLAA